MRRPGASRCASPLESFRPRCARPLEPFRARIIGADARTPNPGSQPTSAADVDADSEAPRLETEVGSGDDEPVGNSMMDEAVPEDGMPGLFQQGDSEDDDESDLVSSRSMRAKMPEQRF